MPVQLRIDSRLRMEASLLPPEVVERLQQAFTYDDPAYQKLARMARRDRRLGWRLKGMSPRVSTWSLVDRDITLPRGALSKVRTILTEAGLSWHVLDVRTAGHGPRYPTPLTHRPAPLEADGGALRWYQHEAVEAAFQRENGLLRAPTGSGKTTTALALIVRVGLPTLVIVWSAGLFDQWLTRLQTELDLGPDQIGIIRGSTRRIRPITLAMQQTLWKRLDSEFASLWGMVVVDEVQRAAARTVSQVVDAFPAHYRIGISADECVARGTLVTMADGTQCPVDKVRPGDFVATPLGPRRVRARIFTGWRQTVRVVTSLGSVRCTTNTWFGTPSGWVNHESLCYLYVYDELLDLRASDAAALPHAVSHGMQAVRLRREGGVRALRAAGAPWQSEGGSSGTASWVRGRSLGEGQDQGNRSSACEDRRAHSSANAAPLASRKASTGGGPPDPFVAGQDGRDDSPAIRQRRAASVHWLPGRQWEAAAGFGGGGRACSQAGGIQARTRGSDGVGEAQPLQAGLRACCEEDCGRDRWNQSPGSQSGRRPQGPAPSLPGMDRGPIRLDARALEAAGQSSALACARVERDWLTVPTFDLSIEGAECFFANGLLVHNSRADGKEFLVYDLFGGVAHQVSQDDLIADGAVLDVECRVVPTEFRADWYVDQRDRGLPPDWNRLLDEITRDDARNALVVDLAVEEAATHQVLVLSQRVEHCQRFDAALSARAIPCDLMLGGDEWADRFDATKEGLASGRLRAACGTIQAVGTGIDMPALSRAVLATPVGSNRQLYGQIRGRLARPGKDDAVLYVLWDRHVQGLSPLKNMLRWNRTVVVRSDDGSWVNGREYLRRLDGTTEEG